MSFRYRYLKSNSESSRSYYVNYKFAMLYVKLFKHIVLVMSKHSNKVLISACSHLFIYEICVCKCFRRRERGKTKLRTTRGAAKSATTKTAWRSCPPPSTGALTAGGAPSFAKPARPACTCRSGTSPMNSCSWRS